MNGTNGRKPTDSRINDPRRGDYVITMEDLKKAIVNRIGLLDDDAGRDAEYVMGIFGFEDCIIDNLLEPEDRQLFYLLEDDGMLKARKDNMMLYDGRDWRTCYWFLDKEKIMEYSENQKQADRRKRLGITEDQMMVQVYESMPEELWSQRETVSKRGIAWPMHRRM